MTVRELIEELEHYAYTYGDGTEVCVLDPMEKATEPTISAGPNKAGDPVWIRIT